MLFVSRTPTLQVEVRPADYSFNDRGSLQVKRPARWIKFNGGLYNCFDKDTCLALISHPSYGKLFYGKVSHKDIIDGVYEKIIDIELENDRKTDSIPAKAMPSQDKLLAQAKKTIQKTLIITGTSNTLSQGVGDAKGDLKVADLIKTPKVHPI